MYKIVPDSVFMFVELVIIITIIVSLFAYYKLFQQIPPRNKSTEIKRFLHNIFLIVMISITNGVFLFKLGETNKNNLFVFINIFLLAVFILISVFNLRIHIKSGKACAEIEIQKIYNNTIQSFVDELNILKHNYNNTITVLNGYVIFKKWDKLEDFMLKINKNLTELVSLDKVVTANMKNIAVLGFLNSNIKKCSQYSISFEISIQSYIKNINTKIYVFINSLQKIVDFCIEGINDSQSELVKKIDLNIFISERDVVFKFSSCFDEKFNPDIFASLLEEELRLEKKLAIQCIEENDKFIIELRVKNGKEW